MLQELLVFRRLFVLRCLKLLFSMLFCFFNFRCCYGNDSVRKAAEIRCQIVGSRDVEIITPCYVTVYKLDNTLLG